MSRIFITYSHLDQDWKEILTTHLKALRVTEHCTWWSDRPGSYSMVRLREAIVEAHLVIMLISPGFLTSNLFTLDNIPALLGWRQTKGLPVIPVLVRPVTWKNIPWLSSLPMFPKNGEFLDEGDQDFIDSQMVGFAEMIASDFIEKPGQIKTVTTERYYPGELSTFHVRMLDRLPGEIDFMQRALQADKLKEDWKNAAIAAGDLCEVSLLLGHVNQAVEYGERAVMHADTSRDWYQRVRQRCTYANALHQAGQSEDAEQLFRVAEAMQQKQLPEYHFLYTLRGYHFCNLLLDLENPDEVMIRAEMNLQIGARKLWFHDMALYNLAIGRAWAMTAIKTGSETTWQFAFKFLHPAVEGTRIGERQDYLPRALITKAAALRLNKHFNAAWADLKEALEVIEFGYLKLHLIDYHFEVARLYRDMGEPGKEGEHQRIAEELVTETGYVNTYSLIPMDD